MKLTKTSVIAFLIVLGACAPKHSIPTGEQKSLNSAAAASAAGPSNYHPVYSNIEDTIVTIKNFRLRTSDGQVVKITTAPMEVDLQDLQALGKGLDLDLTGVTFPGSVAIIDVVEIETDVINQDNRLVSADNSACDLKTPKLLNFYTTAPITLVAGQEYLVKVNFTALNSIQINVVTERDCKCDDDGHSSRSHRQAMTKQHANDDDSSDDDSNDLKDCVEKQTKRCELVNRRQPITQIIRPIDEV